MHAHLYGLDQPADRRSSRPSCDARVVLAYKLSCVRQAHAHQCFPTLVLCNNTSLFLYLT